RSRVRFPVYAHVGRCRCLLAWGAVSGSIPGVCTCRPLPLPVSLGGYGRTDPLLKKSPFIPMV
ncbi:unnamed protein product, partial [Closterium sp. NIES-54]